MSIHLDTPQKEPKKKLIGVYLGSFNPIHMGHISVVERTLAEGFVDEVWVMVSPENPLKERETLAPFADRVEMAELVFQDNPRITVSVFESALPKPSYTIDTMRALHKEYTDTQFCLIVGSDIIHELPKWKEYKALLEDVPFILFERGGVPLSIPTDLPIRVVTSVHQGITLSSTHIRECLDSGVSLEGLVPDTVVDYIKKHQLYGVSR